MTLDTDSPTIELTIAADAASQDRLVAELEFLGFEAFLQEDEVLRAYYPAALWTGELEAETRRFLADLLPAASLSLKTLPPENWNREWERSIQPVVVGRFVIAPSWYREEAEVDRIRLIIDPKMSFGTGYHATTRLMLRLLSTVVHRGDRVLDAGTGTGILAVASARLGATAVIGFDIDPWSERNARENCERNDVVDRVRIQLGDVTTVVESDFDVLLANIQLDVIVGALPAFNTKIRSGGKMLVSGLLQEQADPLITAAAKLDLVITETMTDDEWWACVLQKR